MVAVDFQLIFLRFVFMSNFLSARIYVHIGKKNGRKMKKRKGLIKKIVRKCDWLYRRGSFSLVIRIRNKIVTYDFSLTGD